MGTLWGSDGTAWENLTDAQGGTSDHGSLQGLNDDDHTQYHTDARGDARYYTQGQVDSALAGKSDVGHNHNGVYDPAGTASSAVSTHEAAGDPHPQYATDTDLTSGLATKADTAHTHTESQITDLGSYPDATGQAAVQVAQTDGAGGWTFIDTPSGGGGVTDHGALTGRDDDDHTQYALSDGTRGNFETAGAVAAHEGAADPHSQYLTAAEGNAAYEVSGAVAAHEAAGDPHTQYHTDARGDARYYTQSQVDTSLAGKVNQDATYSTAIATIMRLSQAEYDAIGTPSDSVLYVIVG